MGGGVGFALGAEVDRSTRRSSSGLRMNGARDGRVVLGHPSNKRHAAQQRPLTLSPSKGAPIQQRPALPTQNLCIPHTPVNRSRRPLRAIGMIQPLPQLGLALSSFPDTAPVLHRGRFFCPNVTRAPQSCSPTPPPGVGARAPGGATAPTERASRRGRRSYHIASDAIAPGAALLRANHAAFLSPRPSSGERERVRGGRSSNAPHACPTAPIPGVGARSPGDPTAPAERASRRGRRSYHIASDAIAPGAALLRANHAAFLSPRPSGERVRVRGGCPTLAQPLPPAPSLLHPARENHSTGDPTP